MVFNVWPNVFFFFFLSGRLVRSEGRFGNVHSWSDPVGVSHSQRGSVQLITMKAVDCVLAALLFGKVDKGTSSGSQDLDATDGPNLAKQVYNDGLCYCVIQVSHPDWKELSDWI